MLTAVPTNLVAINEFKASFGSVLVAVTAGVGNAVDVSRTHERQDESHIGTINTWVIVNGCLSEEAFFQAMMTATEAKQRHCNRKIFVMSLVVRLQQVLLRIVY